MLNIILGCGLLLLNLRPFPLRSLLGIEPACASGTAHLSRSCRGCTRDIHRRGSTDTGAGIVDIVDHSSIPWCDRWLLVATRNYAGMDADGRAHLSRRMGDGRDARIDLIR